MLAIIIGGQTLKTGTVGIDDANLIRRLHFEYLADKDDLASWLAGGHLGRIHYRRGESLESSEQVWGRGRGGRDIAGKYKYNEECQFAGKLMRLNPLQDKTPLPLIFLRLRLYTAGRLKLTEGSGSHEPFSYFCVTWMFFSWVLP